MTEEQKAAVHRIEYFLKAWEYAGVGKTIKTVQDSPDTYAAIDVDDLAAILQAATRDDKLVTGECFIVKGSGETDLPVVHIVRDLEGARHAVLSLMYSDPKEADPDEDKGLFADFDDAMADGNYWSIEFEIGGISVERVCLDATRDSPSADAVDAQRYRWLQQQRARVWHQIAEMPIIRTSEFIDANITAEGRWK